jgi:type II secretory pathway component PulJ
MQEKQSDKRYRRYKGGFTIPELLVAICLTAMLLSFFLQCFFTVSAQYRERSALLELQDNLMLAAELLTADIGKSAEVLECDPEKLTLQQTKVVEYSLGRDQQAEEHFYELEGNILYRRENNQQTRQPMANFIKTLTFSYLDQYGRHTALPEEVRAVYLCVTGEWNGRELCTKRLIRLAGAMYL